MNWIYIDEDLKRANRTEIESRNDQNQNWTMIICSREKVDQDENLEQKLEQNEDWFCQELDKSTVSRKPFLQRLGIWPHHTKSLSKNPTLTSPATLVFFVWKREEHLTEKFLIYEDISFHLILSFQGTKLTLRKKLRLDHLPLFCKEKINKMIIKIRSVRKCKRVIDTNEWMRE
jgi:hypothetical protein